MYAGDSIARFVTLFFSLSTSFQSSTISPRISFINWTSLCTMRMWPFYTLRVICLQWQFIMSGTTLLYRFSILDPFLIVPDHMLYSLTICFFISVVKST
ncbi:hypothetical protein BRADI_1g63605v3 [Brachypodium distachyon]|uniref:Uncharacterized protein n=1 Tax=Brachypodium distachyon TaxID=15368 RepID=A0A2K2DT84_BRADI|nr:hypothetical protein BRADI_1g63605v3 [Brachypodium distachyon]